MKSIFILISIFFILPDVSGANEPKRVKWYESHFECDPGYDQRQLITYYKIGEDKVAADKELHTFSGHLTKAKFMFDSKYFFAGLLYDEKKYLNPIGNGSIEVLNVKSQKVLKSNIPTNIKKFEKEMSYQTSVVFSNRKYKVNRSESHYIVFKGKSVFKAPFVGKITVNNFVSTIKYKDKGKERVKKLIYRFSEEYGFIEWKFFASNQLKEHCTISYYNK